DPGEAETGLDNDQLLAGRSLRLPERGLPADRGNALANEAVIDEVARGLGGVEAREKLGIALDLSRLQGPHEVLGVARGGIRVEVEELRVPVGMADRAVGQVTSFVFVRRCEHTVEHLLRMRGVPV